MASENVLCDKLPVELLARIVSQQTLSTRDRCSLSCVCRALRDILSGRSSSRPGQHLWGDLHLNLDKVKFGTAPRDAHADSFTSGLCYGCWEVKKAAWKALLEMPHPELQIVNFLRRRSSAIRSLRLTLTLEDADDAPQCQREFLDEGLPLIASLCRNDFAIFLALRANTWPMGELFSSRSIAALDEAAPVVSGLEFDCGAVVRWDEVLACEVRVWTDLSYPCRIKALCRLRELQELRLVTSNVCEWPAGDCLNGLDEAQRAYIADIADDEETPGITSISPLTALSSSLRKLVLHGHPFLTSLAPEITHLTRFGRVFWHHHLPDSFDGDDAGPEHHQDAAGNWYKFVDLKIEPGALDGPSLVKLHVTGCKLDYAACRLSSPTVRVLEVATYSHRHSDAASHPFKWLPALTRLTWEGAYLTGKWPQTSLAVACPSLQALALPGYVGTGFEADKRLQTALGHLTGLTCLDLSANAVTRLTPSLRHLRNLRSFELDMNRCQWSAFGLTSLSCLLPLSRLQLLRLGGLHAILQTAAIYSLTELRRLIALTALRAGPGASEITTSAEINDWSVAWRQLLSRLESALPGCFVTTASMV